MKPAIAIALLCLSLQASAQQTAVKDSTAFMDSIFREMDALLDGLTAARSFTTISFGAGTGFFNFRTGTAAGVRTEKKLLFSPTIAYFHKTGLGISGTGYAITDSAGLRPYQFSLTPSYDYIKTGRYATGVAYTHYFTRQDLSFYTSPLSNELSAYFTYRKTWLQPGISMSYGWGSREAFEDKQVEWQRLRRLFDPLAVNRTTVESVDDVSLLLSLRHDFSFSHVLGKKDLLTLTPVLMLSSGTQKFGFNTSYQSRNRIVNNFLPGNRYVSASRAFGMQSADAILRADYSTGKFFVQSQVLLDYYLHPAPNRVNNVYALIAGFNL